MVGCVRLINFFCVFSVCLWLLLLNRACFGFVLRVTHLHGY